MHTTWLKISDSAPVLLAETCEYGHEGLDSIYGAEYCDLSLIELFVSELR